LYDDGDDNELQGDDHIISNFENMLANLSSDENESDD